jgi:hypothetical protein
MDTKLTLHYTEFDIKTELTRDEARELELKLNVSTKGHTWKDIGDYLFSFHTGKSVIPYLSVTLEQYNTLNLLKDTPKDDCKKI